MADVMANLTEEIFLLFSFRKENTENTNLFKKLISKTEEIS